MVRNENINEFEISNCYHTSPFSYKTDDSLKYILMDSGVLSLPVTVAKRKYTYINLRLKTANLPRNTRAGERGRIGQDGVGTPLIFFIPVSG